MYRDKKISVVIPCYNEELGIGRVLTLMPPFVDEVIVVDNASTDNTVGIASACGARVIRHHTNLGYGASMKTGFKNALGDIIIACDGDRTYPVEQCQRILEYMLDKNLDFVSCRRFPLMVLESMSLMRKLGNKIIVLAINLLFGLRLKDGLSGMWVFRKSILTKLKLECNDFAFSAEIKIAVFTSCEIKAKELPIIYYGRRDGKSKIFVWRDGANILRSIFKKRLSRLLE